MVAALATPGVALATPGEGLGAPVGGSAVRTSVTVALRPASTAGLAAAATRRGGDRAALARLLPEPTARATVRTFADQHGLQVSAGGGDGWTVRLSGAAAAVRDAFPGAGVPIELRNVAVGVGGLAPAGVWHRHAVAVRAALPGGLSGPDLRAAYGLSGTGSGAGQTVATVQFSGWSHSDLDTYATGAGLSVAPGQVTDISVDGASTTTPAYGGDVEAALDQELLLAAAPAARQRVYVGQPGGTDALAVFARIADEVAAQGISVVSTSWGACELDLPGSEMQAIETQLARITAAGATLLAASGDAGAFDCSRASAPDGRLAVDYPASSPSVVGVGGTHLTRSSAAGSGGWAEGTWWVPSGSSTGFLGNGSGGGASATFPLPAWQRGVAGVGPDRAVPDISSDGDPATGIAFYIGSAGGWVLGGGTSAGAPVQAGLLASGLSGLGPSTPGLGDIHAALYGAPASAFRDVTTGDNGHFAAGPGYDQTTGRGSPLWDRLLPALTGVTPTPAPSPAPTSVPLPVPLPSAGPVAGIPAANGPAPTATAPAGSFFHPLPPTRVLDTRSTSGPVAARDTFALTVAGAGGVPASGGTAVVLNVTVTAPTGSGYLTVWPAGAPRPTASTLNFRAGTTVPNLASVPLGVGGVVDLFNGSGGTVQMLADVVGYYSADASSGAFSPVPPRRVLDTRAGLGGATLPARGTLPLTVAGTGGVPSTGAAAVVMNVTVTRPGGRGYLTVFPSASPRPTASNLNFGPGQTVPNLVVVPLGPDGAVELYDGSDARVDVLADVVGWYGAGPAGTSGAFTPLTPSRVLDTRAASPLGGREVRPLPVAGAGGVPATGATAVVVNVTVVAPTGAGYLTVWPGGTDRPVVSSLNFTPGLTVANLVVVPLGADGTVSLFNGSGGTVHVLADVVGYVTG